MMSVVVLITNRITEKLIPFSNTLSSQNTLLSVLNILKLRRICVVLIHMQIM